VVDVQLLEVCLSASGPRSLSSPRQHEETPVGSSPSLIGWIRYLTKSGRQ